MVRKIRCNLVEEDEGAGTERNPDCGGLAPDLTFVPILLDGRLQSVRRMP